MRDCQCVSPEKYGHSSHCPLDTIEELRAENKALSLKLDRYKKLEAACREWSKIHDPESMFEDPIIWALRDLDGAPK